MSFINKNLDTNLNYDQYVIENMANVGATINTPTLKYQVSNNFTVTTNPSLSFTCNNSGIYRIILSHQFQRTGSLSNKYITLYNSTKVPLPQTSPLSPVTLSDYVIKTCNYPIAISAILPYSTLDDIIDISSSDVLGIRYYGNAAATTLTTLNLLNIILIKID